MPGEIPVMVKLGDIPDKMKYLFMSLIIFLTAGLTYGQENNNRKISIDEAVETGLKNNPAVKAAEKKVASAKGRFWSGISLPQPELGVSYEYVPLNHNLGDYGERTIEVSQSFDFPSGYFIRASKFNKEVEIAYQELIQTKINAVSSIKNAYYNVLLKEEQLKIAQENKDIAEDFYKKADIRYNVGEGTNLERLTAKVQFTETENNMAIAANGLKTAFAELNYSLGYGKVNNEIFELQDSLIFRLEEISFDEISDLSFHVNPQIKIAELNLSVSSIDKKLAWNSLLPGFNISYGRQSLDGNNGFYGASFGVTIPLWFLFEQRGNIQEAAANVSAAESELQAVKNEVYLKIKSVYNDYENNLKQVKLYLSEILPQADEVYRSASASYDAGEITYLEFLQARQTLINAKSNYTNILFNYYHSIFSLEETVGSSLKMKIDGDKK